MLPPSVRPPSDPEAFARWLRERGWEVEPLTAETTLDAGLLAKLAEPLRDSVWMNPLDPMPLWLTTVDGDPGSVTVARARQLARLLPGAIVVGRDRTSPATAIALAEASGNLLARHLPADRTVAGEQELWNCFAQQPDGLRLALALRPRLRRRDLSGRFFRELRAAIRSLSLAFTGLPETAEHHRDALALTLCCRVMFLYFIQQKGWLDGNPRFVANQLLHPEHRDLFRTRLQPLFFSALNRPEADRSQPLRFARIPYLNGGLFAPTALEQRYPDLSLPDETIRSLIADLFERYRFVGNEQDGDAQTIDPHMLGHVFERMMDAAQRARSGTFYTSPGLVRQLVDTTLRHWLTLRSSRREARHLLAALNDPALTVEPRLAASLVGPLDRLRILDPACGSGAFLLGVAERISALRLRLARATGSPLRPDEALRATLTSNLFGIDLSATAIALAELRLWLALVATTPSETDLPIAPLPNLGHRLRQGDALFGQSRLFHGSVGRAVRAELADCRGRLAGAHGSEKDNLEQRCRQLEQELAVLLLRAELEEAQRTSNAPLSNSQISLLEPPGETIAAPEDRRHLEAVEALLRAAEQGDWVPRFEAEVAFAEVFEGGGFDWVIGNPPWVRLSELPATERRALRARYRLLRARRRSGSALLGEEPVNTVRMEPFGSQPDLSVAFAERALELCCREGLVSLLVPAKVLRSRYGAPLRATLAQEHRLLRIEDLSEDGERHFGADTYPAMLVVQRGRGEPIASHPIRPGPRVELRIAPHRETLLRASELALNGDRPWPLLPPELSEIDRILAQCPDRIADRFTPRMGIKTGANDLFLRPPEGIGPTRPALLGRDLSQHAPTPQPLLFAYDDRGRPLREVPDTTAAYLEAHRTRLESRSDFERSEPLWLLGRVRAELLGHRVAWPDIARLLQAVPLAPVREGGPLLLNTCYYVATAGSAEAQLIARWLQTAPLRAVARWQSERALSGYRRYNADAVARLPLPAALLDRARPIAQRFAALRPADTDLADTLACQLLGLSPTHLALLRRFVAEAA